MMSVESVRRRHLPGLKRHSVLGPGKLGYLYVKGKEAEMLDSS